MTKAQLITVISVDDPGTNSQVDVAIYKHENGAMFGVDASFIDQYFDDDELCILPDMFSNNYDNVILNE